MFNVCWQCGIYRADKAIDPTGPYAICPECGYAHRFRFLPLFIISGASGTGKTAILRRLVGRLPRVVLIDVDDVLWRAEFNTPNDGYRAFFEAALRLCKNIGQSGRPVAAFNSGMGVPANLVPCIERRYFAAVHTLALVCDDGALAERLRQRPAWRQSADEPFIAAQVDFNRWLKAYDGHPPITRVDTSLPWVDEPAAQVADWIEARLP